MCVHVFHLVQPARDRATTQIQILEISLALTKHKILHTHVNEFK